MTTIKRYQNWLKGVDKIITIEQAEFETMLAIENYDSALNHYHCLKMWKEIRTEIQSELNTLITANL